MSVERWEEVTELFRQAVEQPEPERESFLDNSLYSQEVRDQVALLLIGDAGAERGGFLRPFGMADFASGPVPNPHFAARRGIHLRCPQCEYPIEVVEAKIPPEFTCEHCGTTIRTGAGSTGVLESRKGDTLRWEPSAALRIFGRFTLIHWVGEGGFGIVYKARDPGMDRIVALKVPRLGNLGTDKDRVEFLREAKATGQLRHSSIVPVYEVGEVEGTPFIVSEFVDGVTIAELLTDPGPATDFRQCARIAADLADALQHAHDRGVVHRDVKPSNIMIDRQGLPRLMDFGLAKRGEAELTIAVSGRPMGTPSYMSPEQARGEGGQVDGRTDVYGLGGVLYFLLTGSAPFAGTERMIILKVINDEPPAPRNLNERIPRDLQTICQTAMAKEPSRRYATALALGADLRCYLEGRPISARPASWFEKAWRVCARNPKLSLAITTAAASLVAVAIVSAMLAFTTARSAAARKSQISLDYLNKALRFLERDEIGPGLVWLERARELAVEVGDADLAQAASANIAAWSLEHPTMRSAFSHPSEVRRAALSPDGRSLIVAGSDGTARLWNVATGESIGEPLLHGVNLRSVAFSPDGRLVLTAGEDGTLRLWVASTGLEANVKPSGVGFALREAAFGEEGRTIVALYQDGIFRRWDLATGLPLGGPIGKPSRFTTASAISPSGRLGLVATIAADNTREVRLWNLIAGTPIGGPLGHAEGVWSAAFSPDETLVATGCGDSFARIWDVAKATQVGQPLPCHEGIAGLCFSPDGASLALPTGEKTARVFDVATGQPRGSELRTGAGTRVMVFSPDGLILATGGVDGRARLWDPRTGRPIGLALPHQADLTHLAFLPDSRSILTCSSEKVARIWSVDALVVPIGPPSVTGKDVTAALSPDGSVVVFGDESGAVQLVSGLDGRPILPPWSHGESVTVLALAGDGGTVLVGGARGRVELRRLADGRPVGPALTLAGPGISAAFSGDGSTAVVGCEGGTAQVIDARTGRARGPSLTHEGRVQRVDVNADGSLVATGSTDRRVRLWNGFTSASIGVPLPHVGEVVGLALSPDGTRLIVADRDGPARLWDVASGRQLARLDHNGPVITVKFSPDGRTALTGGSDAKVRLWDGTTGLRKALLHSGLGDMVVTAAFSDEGRLVAIGCRNGEVRLWDVATGLLVGPRSLVTGRVVRRLAFHRDRIVILGRLSENTADVWSIPRLAPPDVSSLTGLKLDEWDEVVTLDGPTLQARRSAAKRP